MTEPDAVVWRDGAPENDGRRTPAHLHVGMRVRCHFHAFVSFLAVLPLCADSPSAPEPRVFVSGSGTFAFSMVPAPSREWKTDEAEGIAYSITRSGKLEEIWRTKGWYSFQVFVANDGRHLVRMGPWNEGHEMKSDHLAVAFYREGKQLKSYSTVDLVRDPAKLLRSSSHYRWLADNFGSGVASASDGPLLGGDGRFTLTTIDGATYWFDITTGEIVSMKTAAEQAGGRATIAEVDRICVAVALVDEPFEYTDLEKHIGLPAKAKPMPFAYGIGGVTVQCLLTESGADRGHYQLEAEVRTPRSGMDFLTKPLEGKVEKVRLLYVTPDRRKIEVNVPGGELGKTIEAARASLRVSGESPRTVSERIVAQFNGRGVFLR